MSAKFTTFSDDELLLIYAVFQRRAQELANTRLKDGKNFTGKNLIEQFEWYRMNILWKELEVELESRVDAAGSLSGQGAKEQ